MRGVRGFIIDVGIGGLLHGAWSSGFRVLAVTEWGILVFWYRRLRLRLGIHRIHTILFRVGAIGRLVLLVLLTNCV